METDIIKMLEWAKREVEIAKNKERENVPENKWKHKQDRYDDAFKTFQSLCEYTASNNYEVSIIICNSQTAKCFGRRLFGQGQITIN